MSHKRIGLPSPEGNPIIKQVYGIDAVIVVDPRSREDGGNERFIPIAPWSAVRLRLKINQNARLTLFFADSNGNEIGGRVPSVGTLTFTGNPSDGDTVTIGGKVYTHQTVLTDVDGNVLIGADASASLDNLIAAINLDTVVGTTSAPGTLYAAAMTRNVDVGAAAGAGDTMVVTALYGGNSGNAIDTTETYTPAGNIWGGATLASGVDNTDIAADDTMIMADTELIANITAAEHVGEAWLGIRIGELAAAATVSVCEASGSSF